MLCQNIICFFFTAPFTANTSHMPAKYLQIKGKVQGVFYRASAREMAAKLGITGWIKNVSDGSVEACIAGTEKSVADFVAWCKAGPQGAVVSSVDVRDAGREESFDGFHIIKD